MTKLAPALLVLAAVAAYANSLGNPFVFDDQGAIVENRHLRSLWPLSHALGAPPQATVAGRPLISLSLALNYAVGGLDVRGYHAFNLAVHVACGLLLFGIVRRTALSVCLAPSIRSSASGIALSSALIWLLHPLGSEVIDYVVQRTESVMALFYLLTLYFAVRAVGSARAGGLNALAVSACAAGMASKESMVTAPVAVVLHDLAYHPDPWRERLGKRWLLYLGLGATWILLGALMAAGPRSETVGFDVGISAFEYARNQCVVILDYLRTAFWPHPLVFDYGDARALPAGLAWPQAAGLGLLAAASALLFRRRPALGFPAVWVFLTLAPTSSCVPIASEVGAERRMYLPLAGLVVLVVVLAFRAIEGLAARAGRPGAAWPVAAALTAAVSLALGATTARRNLDYRSGESIWGSAVRARPENPRAHANLGQAVHVAGRPSDAIAHYERALSLDPRYGQALFNLGVALADLGRGDEAIARYRQALHENPVLDGAHHNLGAELANRGRLDEAIGHFREALRLAPESAAAHRSLGRALRLTGDASAAVESLRQAVRLDPEMADAAADLAWILATHPDARLRAPGEAVELAERAVALTSGRHAVSLDTLAAALAAVGRFDEAASAARRALGVAREKGALDLASEIASRLALYERGLAYREPASP